MIFVGDLGTVVGLLMFWGSGLGITGLLILLT